MAASGGTLTWSTSSVSLLVGETITVNYTTTFTDAQSSYLTSTLGSIVTITEGTNQISLTGIAEGSATIASGTTVGFETTTTNALTVTVGGQAEPEPVEDESYLNKRGLTHFWENVDNLKQDKLTVGSNITISDENVISAVQPTVGNATLTIQKNGTSAGTFTANATSNKSINITVPTKTSDITNDSNFVTDSSYVHTDNNYTTTEKNKLSGIAAGAEVNVQSDWNQTTTTADDYIKNKPTLATVATSGSYNDLSNKPTIPAAQVQSDWTQTTTTAVDYIKNKPTLATVATSGSYSDLSNKPTVDSSLSFSSTNAVENQTITNTIYDKNSSDDKESGVNVEFSNPTLNPYVHIGSKSSATKGNSSVGIGYNAESSAVRSVAIGPSATATKREGVALGANAAAGQYSLSIGYYTNTVPNYSTAVGPYAKVLTGATNATAIGYQSEADEAETISVGKSTNKRRIVNVADGTTATDAATVGQIPTKTSDLTNDANFAVDSNVVHKTGAETITGEKTFSGTKLKVMGSGTAGYRFNFYAEKRFDALSGGTSYANWDEAKKDGTWHRIWKLAFPTGCNFWGRLTIGITGSWSSFNASGYMEKQINVAFNGANLYNNVGRYSALGLNVEKDFRISECIWNSDTSQWEIIIYSHQPQGNNAPRTVVLKFETYQEALITAFEGITISTTPEISQIASYVNPKATVDGASKTFYFADLPVYQDPYGYEILNKTNAAAVAVSGSYNDLTDKPTIPTVNNATLTIQKNGSNVQTFTANQSTNATANITVPTKTSDLTNDSNYVTNTTYASANSAGVIKVGNNLSISNGVLSATGGASYTEGSHIDITNNTISAVDYVHSDDPVTTGAVTPVVTNSMVATGTLTSDKFASGELLTLTMSTTDIGEGAPLAANTLYGVYE